MKNTFANIIEDLGTLSTQQLEILIESCKIEQAKRKGLDAVNTIRATPKAKKA